MSHQSPTEPYLKHLLDPGSFYEFAPHLKRRPDRYGGSEPFPGAGVVAGFGKAEGRRLALFALGAAEDGTFSEMGAQKVGQLLALAREGGLPVVGVYRSTGLDPREGLYGWAGPPELLWQQAQASGLTPQIAVVIGSVPGALALSVGLADFVIWAGREDWVFLESGAAVRGWEGGLAHFIVADEAEAMLLARRLLSYLPSNNLEAPPFAAPSDDPWRMEAVLDALVPDDPSLPYDMQIAIDAVFDRDSFLEVQAEFARNVIAGLARLHGAVVGVVAQQPTILAGVLDIDASDKLARFIRTCDAFNLPLITFVDSPGFLPGVDQEHGGIIRHGAKIVYAYSEATVPKISVVTRKAYGGAYIVMSSKHIRTDLCFAWPSAEIAVLGAEGAVNVLYRKRLKASDDPEAERTRLVDEFAARFATPFQPAASGHIDDVIRPAETRPRLIAALETLKDKRVAGSRKKHGNMPV